MPPDLHATSPEAAAEALMTPPTEAHRIDQAEAPTEVLHTNRSGPATAPAPRLADGVEMIGEFEDSGFKQAPYIARRRDGQVVQMPEMLFRLAEQIDGKANVEEIATRFSHAIRRQVDGATAQMLIDEQLRPLGIVAPPDGSDSVELDKVDPLLALKFRAALVPDSVVRSVTTVFRPLFLPPVVIAVVAGLIGLDGWLFFVHGISQSVRQTIYDPALMLMLIAGVIVATTFHEIGHATATRYGGAEPGVMGVGIYVVWPAFYTDITDAYRLGKWGRLRADLGGMYFNAVFALLVAGVYALTSFEPLLLLIMLQTFAIIQQALPLLRLDGYYILSDLTGVPDIFLRIRAVLASLIPGRPADKRVTELKSWVRVVVSAYILFIVVFLGVSVLAMVINLPRIIATGYDSAAVRFDAIGPAFSQGGATTGAFDLIQMLFLILPAAGLLYTGVRVGRRVGTGAFSWSAGHPTRQATLGLAGAAAVALAAFSWWPNGEYRPVQPGERGTLAGLFQQIAALPTLRPSLTVQRDRQLGGAPTMVQRDRQLRSSHTMTRRATPASPRAGHTTTTTTTTATTTPTTGSTSTTTTTAPSSTITSTTTTPSSSSVPTSTGTTTTTSTTPTTGGSTTTTTPTAP
jgi:putative peptide zinc metalloprotease protein